MAHSTIHYVLDGTCVVCESTEAELDGFGQDETRIALESGSLVYWIIRGRGLGDIDETFAPTLREAQEFAESLHGRGVFVRLNHSLLELAA